MLAGRPARVRGAGAAGSAYVQTSSDRPPGSSRAARALAIVASILARLRMMPGSASSRSTSSSPNAATAGDGEPGEGGAEVLPLAQDRQPGQAGLEGLQGEPLEHAVVAVHRARPTPRRGRRCSRGPRSAQEQRTRPSPEPLTRSSSPSSGSTPRGGGRPGRRRTARALPRAVLRRGVRLPAGGRGVRLRRAGPAGPGGVPRRGLLLLAGAPGRAHGRLLSALPGVLPGVLLAGVPPRGLLRLGLRRVLLRRVLRHVLAGGAVPRRPGHAVPRFLGRLRGRRAVPHGPLPAHAVGRGQRPGRAEGDGRGAAVDLGGLALRRLRQVLGARRPRRPRRTPSAGLWAVAVQLREPLLEDGDAGVPFAQRGRHPAQRLVHGLGVVADERDRKPQRHEVDRREPPGLGQLERRDVRRELGHLTAVAQGDRDHAARGRRARQRRVRPAHRNRATSRRPVPAARRTRAGRTGLRARPRRPRLRWG